MTSVTFIILWISFFNASNPSPLSSPSTFLDSTLFCGNKGMRPVNITLKSSVFINYESVSQWWQNLYFGMNGSFFVILWASLSLHHLCADVSESNEWVSCVHISPAACVLWFLTRFRLSHVKSLWWWWWWWCSVEESRCLLFIDDFWHIDYQFDMTLAF